MSTPNAATSKPAPPELGLRARFRAPADRFDDATLQASLLTTEGEVCVAEEPAWGQRPWRAWIARFWRVWSLLVVAMTVGRLRPSYAVTAAAPTGPSLRQQIVGERLPALRRAIAAIRRLKRPINRKMLDRERRRIGRLDLAPLLSWRAIRLRLYLVVLVIRIMLTWIWVNREPIFYWTLVLVILVLFLLLLGSLLQNWAWIADQLNSVIGTRLVPGGR